MLDVTQTNQSQKVLFSLSLVVYTAVQCKTASPSFMSARFARKGVDAFRFLACFFVRGCCSRVPDLVVAGTGAQCNNSHNMQLGAALPALPA